MTAVLPDYHRFEESLAGFERARHWYVGFSGGIDSTVLLHLLHSWRRAHPGSPPLTAIHINHGIQAQATSWQRHCEHACNLLHIPCISLPVLVETGDSGLEAAAREARYRQFETLLEAGDVLFLGHHLDDQIETFFLRLMRGAGVTGLAAIPANRELGAGRLARPLLSIDRAQLEIYAQAHGLLHVEDPSNDDVSLDRNFLRRQVLPQLATRWPGYRKTVARASGHMAATMQALEQVLPAPETLYSAMGDPGIPLAELIDVPLETAGLTLRNWLQLLGQQAPDSALLQEFQRQLRESGPDAAPLLNCGAYRLQRYRGAVYLLPGPAEFVAPLPLALSVGDVYEVAGVGRVSLQPVVGEGLSLSSDEVLSLVWREGGERCTPLGRGGSVSLKKLLQESGVPPWWRARVPLLLLGGELLAAGGLPPCASSRWSGPAEIDQTRWELVWEREGDVAFD